MAALVYKNGAIVSVAQRLSASKATLNLALAWFSNHAYQGKVIGALGQAGVKRECGQDRSLQGEEFDAAAAPATVGDFPSALTPLEALCASGKAVEDGSQARRPADGAAQPNAVGGTAGGSMATLFASRRRVGGRLTTFRSFAGHSRQSATGANPPGLNATRRNWLVRTSLLAILAAGPAFAADEAKPTETAATPDLPSILTSIPTLAPVVEFKKQLMDQGVVLQLNYMGEALGNPSGGVRRGAVYDGRVELAIDADMEKLAHWKGGMIHANGYWIQGTGLSRYYIGNILTASNIEAPPTVRLYELWFEQKALDDRLGLRVGQLAADTEFFVSKYGALFINGTFGWPTSIPSQSLFYP
ncbi:hypothetical protein M2322_004342 [Rhodoblastus acidophilus]|nr:hypothetical protein [Rhodoblastus acidophilus]